MSQAPLLLELFTEELPPKALKRLGQSFSEGITQYLKSAGLLADASVSTSYATPRRLAVHITNVLAKAPNRSVQEKLLPVSIALDANGQATAPLLKKLASLGFPDTRIEDLERQGKDKSESFYLTVEVTGVDLANGLQQAIDQTLTKLPIPKVMRYQVAPGTPAAQDVEFVRPAHGLVALHGDKTISIKTLGLSSQDTTLGHRFLSHGAIKITHADNYAAQLESSGKVIASFDVRLEKIRQSLQNAAKGKTVLMPEALLEEVCALIEWPVVYTCEFEKEFLNKLLNKKGKFIDIETLNYVLGLSKKSPEIQKKNRSEFLNKLNHKLKDVFSTDDTIIIRVKDEEDKRVFVYQLSVEYFEKIEELL